MAKRRAVSVDQLIKKKFIDIPLTGRFKKLLGNPERSGSWFVYGESANGKTTFLMQLARELAMLPKTKVVYNTLEEGARKSMQAAVIDNNMDQCPKGSFMILDREPISELRNRLSKHKSPNVIFIDSVQYADLDKASYKALISDFPKKLFIFNSHAQGKRPVGAIGRDILFDADIKIRVEGFKAFSKSRMSRGKLTDDYIIWHQGAADYWGDL